MLNERKAWGIFPYLVITVSSWFVYKLLIKPFLSPLRKIPGRPYKPIIGNMFEALKEEAMNNSINWMKELNSRFIRFYYLYGEEQLLTGDPDIVKYITVTNSKNYCHNSSPGLMNSLTPNFILFLNGEAHHNVKRLMNPAFNTHTVNGFISIFDKTAQKAVSLWTAAIEDSKDGVAVVPAQDDMARITLDVICECGFDYKMQCLEQPSSPAVQSFKHILKGFQVRLSQMIPLISRIPTKEKLKQEADIAFFKSTILEVVKEKRNRIESGQTNSKDLLSLLLMAKDEHGNGLSDDIIFSQVGGFLFAGFETSSVALTWTLIMLAEHQEEQEKARQEVMSLLQENSPITAEVLEKLTYLTCVIKESLRLFPPASSHFRQAISDDVIQGYTIPAGTKIGISSSALHRLPENWKDPDSFIPERFLQPYNPYAFMPFSAGPYMCIGHRFAMNEIKVVLARLLQSFRMNLVPSYKYRRIRQLTVQPYPPLVLRVSLIKAK